MVDFLRRMVFYGCTFSKETKINTASHKKENYTEDFICVVLKLDFKPWGFLHDERK